MENALKWISPRSVPGSFLLAILAHAAIYGGALLLVSIGFHRHQEPQADPEEITYETFSEPPAPAPVARPVAETPEPETPDQDNEKTDMAPKELHDDSSAIAGTQAAAKPQAATGAQGAGDAAATPYYKIRPKYPRAALVSGIEGWVLMKVDINEKGEVENLRVVGGQERSMFESEARRAVEKWKYRPFLDESGKPVRKADHEVRVDFKLKDAA